MAAAETIRESLAVQVTAEQHVAIRHAAERAHVSVSRFVVDAALRAAQLSEAKKPRRTQEELAEIIRALREEYQAKNPGRDPLAEFLAERRAEAARE